MAFGGSDALDRKSICRELIGGASKTIEKAGGCATTGAAGDTNDANAEAGGATKGAAGGTSDADEKAGSAKTGAACDASKANEGAGRATTTGAAGHASEANEGVGRAPTTGAAGHASEANEGAGRATTTGAAGHASDASEGAGRDTTTGAAGHASAVNDGPGAGRGDATFGARTRGAFTTPKDANSFCAAGTRVEGNGGFASVASYSAGAPSARSFRGERVVSAISRSESSSDEFSSRLRRLLRSERPVRTRVWVPRAFAATGATWGRVEGSCAFESAAAASSICARRSSIALVAAARWFRIVVCRSRMACNNASIAGTGMGFAARRSAVRAASRRKWRRR